MAGIVIADASPLMALARVNGLNWLQALFSEVRVIEEVFAEVLTGAFPASEASIRQARSAGWLRVVAIKTQEPSLPDLDEGEASSLRLAWRANAGSSLQPGRCSLPCMPVMSASLQR